MGWPRLFLKCEPSQGLFHSSIYVNRPPPPITYKTPLDSAYLDQYAWWGDPVHLSLQPHHLPPWNCFRLYLTFELFSKMPADTETSQCLWQTTLVISWVHMPLLCSAHTHLLDKTFLTMQITFTFSLYDLCTYYYIKYMTF